MVLFKGLLKYSATIFLVIFCAFASLAAANDLSLQSDANAQTMHPENEPPLQTSGGFTSESFTEYAKNIRIMITAPEHPNMPVGSVNESLEESVAITLHKDGDKIIWSLGPSLRRFSLNPIDNINNLQVLLKYKF
jgi:hypothetical protein